jgi:hypothetical protein
MRRSPVFRVLSFGSPRSAGRARCIPALELAAALVAWPMGFGCSGKGSMAEPVARDAAVAQPTSGTDASFQFGGGSSPMMTPPAGPPEASAMDAGEAQAPCTGDGGPGTFTCTGSLSVPRDVPAGATLSDGTVLVAGGWNESGVLTSAEIYDPATGTFTPTGTMGDGHLWAGWGAPLPVLANGKVLVAGGLDTLGALSASAELYDPSARAFSVTGQLAVPAISMAPVVLEDGSVLFVGGWNFVTPATVSELPGWSYTGSGTAVVQRYFPALGSFHTTGSLSENRLFGCNVRVSSSGDVLAIAGAQGPDAIEHNVERYDPPTGVWTAVATFTGAAFCAGAFALPNGNVLLTGTGGLNGDTLPIPGVALFDPPDTIAPTTDALAGYSPTFVQLANGDVLAFGGTLNGITTVVAQVYSAATNTWRTVGSLNQPRAGAVGAFLLASGEVLIVGGTNENGTPLATAEIYHP